MITAVNSVSFKYPNRFNQNNSGFGQVRIAAAKDTVSYTALSGKSLNPLYNVAMKTFRASVSASKRRYSPIVKNLANRINEVYVTTKDKKKLIAWDIKADNSDKYIIFFHGASQNITNNQPIYQKFIDNNFNVFAGEYRAFGKNKKCHVDELTIKKDIDAMIDYLIKEKGVKPENIGIIGHSMGGYSAAVAANKLPKCRFLILINSINSLGSEVHTLINSPKFKIPKFVKKLLQRFPIIMRTLNNVLQTGKKIRKVNIPTYIIHAADDKIISMKTAQNLVNNTKNLQDFVLLESGGHVLESTKIDAVDSILKSLNN